MKLSARLGAVLAAVTTFGGMLLAGVGPSLHLSEGATLAGYRGPGIDLVPNDGTLAILQPVVFHVLYKKSGEGKVPFRVLKKQVEQLNLAFSAQEARTKKYQKGKDAHIRFTLHAVRYIQNDEWYDNCALSNYQPVIKKALALLPERYLNVYSCHATASLGLSWLPYQPYRWPTEREAKLLGENSPMLGVIVDSGVLPGSKYFKGRWKQGDILTHEVGHHYGLNHIYEGGCVGDEFLADQISDTPRQNGNLQGTCAELAGKNTCPQPGRDDIQNYMGVAADNCRSHFTPGQVNYMRTIIERYKPTLLENKAVGCIAAINDADLSPDLLPCVGSSFQQNGMRVCHTSVTSNTCADGSCKVARACCPAMGESCYNGTPAF